MSFLLFRNKPPAASVRRAGQLATNTPRGLPSGPVEELPDQAWTSLEEPDFPGHFLPWTQGLPEPGYDSSESRNRTAYESLTPPVASQNVIVIICSTELRVSIPQQPPDWTFRTFIHGLVFFSVFQEPDSRCFLMDHINLGRLEHWP
jgi:hypothetical protein